VVNYKRQEYFSHKYYSERLNYKTNFIGRYDESKAIIKKISATNGTFLSEELVSNMFLFVIEESNSSQKNSNLRVRDLLKYNKKLISKSFLNIYVCSFSNQLFRQARFRRYCLCMFYIWFVIYGTYYGLTLFSPGPEIKHIPTPKL